MKQNKIIKWLYGLFMLLPMLCVGVKCLYVSFNKNAYQSYSGDTSQTTQLEQIDMEDYVIDNDYIINTSEFLTTVTSNGTQIINVDGATINNNVYNEASILRFYVTNDYFYVQLRDSNNTTLNTYSFTNQYITLEFKYLSQNNSNYSNVLNNYSFYKVISSDSYLDNAFYYAIDEFNDIGFDKLDFVSWFSVFYNNTNIYTTFANCYINYMLFVTVAFFIPRVLLWFVNFAYSMADAFSKKTDGGGY